MTRAEFAPDWEGWRAAARALLSDGVQPAEIVCTERGAEPSLLDGLAAGPSRQAASAAPASRVPHAFLDLGEAVACHRDPERWALLYRVLWRLTHGEPRLLDVAVDADVHRLVGMERTIRRDVHKMHAFVRFRATGPDDTPLYVAWYEPAHRIVRRASPFFARRFAAMRWCVLTPGEYAHWDGDALRFAPGLPRSAAPEPNALEELWLTYYAHIFNPARLRTRAMRAEMPERFWKNLPEAALIPALVREAPERVRRMVDAAAQRPPV